jgi:hypothetical protein
MPDYAGLSSEWQDMLVRRRAMGDALALWTLVLDGWRDWQNCGVDPLDWRGTLSLAQLLPPDSDPAS